MGGGRVSPRVRWLITRPCDGCKEVLAHTATEAMAELASKASDPDTQLTTVRCGRCKRVNVIRARDYVGAA